MPKADEAQPRSEAIPYSRAIYKEPLYPGSVINSSA